MNLIPRNFGFEDFFDDLFPAERPLKNNELKCDIYEKDGKYHLEMDVPGFKKENLNIECDNGYLVITASKENKEHDESKNYIRKERSYSKYQRSFYVGDIDTNEIKANFKEGILHVIVPTAEKKKIQTKISID